MINLNEIMMMKVMDDRWDDEWIVKGEWSCWWVDERMQWCEDKYSYKVRHLKMWRKIKDLIMKVEMINLMKMM